MNSLLLVTILTIPNYKPIDIVGHYDCNYRGHKAYMIFLKGGKYICAMGKGPNAYNWVGEYKVNHNILSIKERLTPVLNNPYIEWSAELNYEYGMLSGKLTQDETDPGWLTLKRIK